MSVGAARCWLWLAFALMVPFPMLGPFGGFVPAVRCVILFAATAAVAVVEGAAGPVPGILLLFAVHAAVMLALTGLLAWAASRALGALSGPARRRAVWLAIVGMLALALAFEPYETSFGREPTANLLGVLS